MFCKSVRTCVKLQKGRTLWHHHSILVVALQHFPTICHGACLKWLAKNCGQRGNRCLMCTFSAMLQRDLGFIRHAHGALLCRPCLPTPCPEVHRDDCRVIYQSSKWSCSIADNLAFVASYHRLYCVRYRRTSQCISVEAPHIVRKAIGWVETPTPQSRGIHMHNFCLCRFFIFWLILLLTHQMAVGLFRLAGWVGRTLVTAATLGSLVLFFVIVLGGYVLAKRAQLLASVANCASFSSIWPLSLGHDHVSLLTKVMLS